MNPLTCPHPATPANKSPTCSDNLLALPAGLPRGTRCTTGCRRQPTGQRPASSRPWRRTRTAARRPCRGPRGQARCSTSAVKSPPASPVLTALLGSKKQCRSVSARGQCSTLATRRKISRCQHDVAIPHLDGELAVQYVQINSSVRCSRSCQITNWPSRTADIARRSRPAAVTVRARAGCTQRMSR